jgi:hypothetical protein
VQQERDVNRNAALAQDDIAASTQRVQPATDELNGGQVRQQQVLVQDDHIAAPGHWAAEGDIAMPPAHYGPIEDDIAPQQHRGQRIAERRVAENGHQPIPNPALRPTFANIPAELRALRNWVMWRYVQKPDKKKPDKVPFQPNGNHAKTTARLGTHSMFAALRTMGAGSMASASYSTATSVTMGFATSVPISMTASKTATFQNLQAAGLSGFGPTQKFR